MSLPQKLDKCPKTKECVVKVVFQDEDGNLYRFDNKTKTFKDHQCSTKNSAELPKIAYSAEWYNRNTGRTRFQGPERMKRSVQKPPTDEAYRKRGSNPAWVHKQTFIAELDWKPVED